jgi:hypothetical protein
MTKMRWKVQWDFCGTWTDVATCFDRCKTADEYARSLSKRWPLHDFRVVWYRDAKQTA